MTTRVSARSTKGQPPERLGFTTTTSSKTNEKKEGEATETAKDSKTDKGSATTTANVTTTATAKPRFAEMSARNVRD